MQADRDISHLNGNAEETIESYDFDHQTKLTDEFFHMGEFRPGLQSGSELTGASKHREPLSLAHSEGLGSL